MAEAEDVLTDIARHATVYARKLWQRHRRPENAPRVLLTDITHRLDLFILSAMGKHFPIRVAQAPTPPTLLARVFRYSQFPWCTQAIPATDGRNLWLPPCLPSANAALAQQLFRTMALQQAARAARGSIALIEQLPDPLTRDLHLLIEAHAVDEMLVQNFPGMRQHIHQLRQFALQTRPSLTDFSAARQPLEIFYRKLLQQTFGSHNDFLQTSSSPAQSIIIAKKLLPTIIQARTGYAMRTHSATPLVKDLWTGDLRLPDPKSPIAILTASDAVDSPHRPRAAQLPRRPQIRKAAKDEDKKNKKDAAWMVQGDESHSKAEDPMGLQRPIDRDEDTDAEEYADLVSELSEARLVSTPGQSREVLVSEDTPTRQSRLHSAAISLHVSDYEYPEWDYQQEIYLDPGAKIRVSHMHEGSQQWVDDTLQQHQALIAGIRRRFELLRAQRILLRQQMDGEELDLDAYVGSYADFRAGDTLNQALYQTRRVAEKNVAIMLLVDVSGSTDSWIANNRRIIDVEREALLLVTIALQSLGEPFSVLAFSGEGPQAVQIWQVKHHNEAFSNDIALRISALQPERYTRTGAALRHATAELMTVTATHRLLIVLSDGKPNDNDNYEGRYGVEDTRQAVQEARNQGIQPFCLTVDRQAANYLPFIFGAHHYALLPHPEQLPRVLLEWMKRLLAS